MMSRVLWRRQWALWAEGSVATLVSMCFMSQTNQIPPSDDTGKVHNAPGSTPPAYDHQPSVAIISVVCYDHQPSVTIIWFVCHNHHPSYGFWARWQPIVHHFIMTERSWLAFHTSCHIGVTFTVTPTVHGSTVLPPSG